MPTPHTIKLTYFKPSGKYYTSESITTPLATLPISWSQVRQWHNDGQLPGLTGASQGWTVLIEVPTHPHNHPRLIFP